MPENRPPAERCSLSYVITTRNKLPFLREVLARVGASLQPDEEIAVVDAASTDGTARYLRELYDAGTIQRYLSEPDLGEGHGYNKGIFLSRGELIKIHTDDDVYYYPGIQACKTFMLANPDIDAICTEGGRTDWAAGGPCLSEAAAEWTRNYRRWRETFTPFSFCCNGLMLRRSSIPRTGLFNVRFVAVDVEFSLRITAERHRLAWYTGICWVGNNNPRSQSVTKGRRMEREVKLLEERYLGRKRYRLLERGREGLKEAERWGKENLRGFLGIRKNKSWPFPDDIAETFAACDRWLEKVNRSRENEFLLPPGYVS